MPRPGRGGSSAPEILPGGPKTGEEAPKRPPRLSKRVPNRRQIATRRPRWSLDGLSGLQDAPRGLQEASQEPPKKQKSLLFHWYLKVFVCFRVIGFPTLQGGSRGPQDVPETAQEAPVTALRRPKRAPRRRERPPRRPKRPPRRLQEGAQTGDPNGSFEPSAPKSPLAASRGPEEAPTRPR